MSWEQLQSILKEARERREEERREPPIACPIDGTPLLYHPGKGVLHCPNGDFQTQGRPREE